jgi:hypothetical protein
LRRQEESEYLSLFLVAWDERKGSSANPILVGDSVRSLQLGVVYDEECCEQMSEDRLMW